ncbi:tyrosine-type recombinase/integrase [Ruegeria arenilitoris]|uniref:tyrosine-type recombinase/integrase n=1 Tax=Ruegeria arenilitoris TaxID=1173585 RepID=UPI003464A998
MAGNSAGKIKAAQVTKLPDGRHSDGRGLYLYVTGSSRSWFYRYTDHNKKRREMSLGTVEVLTLKEAREKRDEMAISRSRGRDPMAERAKGGRTVAELVDEAFEAIKPNLKDGGNAGRWMSPVRVHILPKLGHRDITTLTSVEVRDVLEPIWRTKTSAAAKAMDRLGITMRHAAAKFPGEVDATVVPNARILLGSQGHKVQHIPAMPWKDVPAFYKSLGTNTAELALRLLILTASRSAPVRLAKLDQFDGDTWTIPAENMKGGKEFRIPLSEEAQSIVEFARPLAHDGFLFCAVRRKPISDMAMTAVMKSRGLVYRPHGFRSSFRDWCAETGQDWHLAEASLDHQVGGKVQRAYQRSDLLEQRRPLLYQWSNLLLTSER